MPPNEDGRKHSGEAGSAPVTCEVVTAGRRDHIVEATLTGTAVARFARAGQHHDRPALPIKALGPQQNQAARTRI